MKRKNVMICLSMLLALFSAGAATGEEVQTELETQNLSKMKTEPETESDIQTESLGFYFDRLDTEVAVCLQRDLLSTSGRRSGYRTFFSDLRR